MCHKIWKRFSFSRLQTKAQFSFPKKTPNKNWQETNWTIHSNLHIAKDREAQVCLPGCIPITFGRILVYFLTKKFYKQQSVFFCSGMSEKCHSLLFIRRDWVKCALSWRSPPKKRPQHSHRFGRQLDVLSFSRFKAFGPVLCHRTAFLCVARVVPPLIVCLSDCACVQVSYAVHTTEAKLWLVRGFFQSN